MLQQQQNRGTGNQSQSIKIGAPDDERQKLADVARARGGYYTTEEVAILTNRSARKVQDMCAAGEIPTMPRAEGERAWRIPLDFDQPKPAPLAAATGGSVPHPADHTDLSHPEPEN